MHSGNVNTNTNWKSKSCLPSIIVFGVFGVGVFTFGIFASYKRYKCTQYLYNLHNMIIKKLQVYKSNITITQANQIKGTCANATSRRKSQRSHNEPRRISATLILYIACKDSVEKQSSIGY